jgi:hypothetical protein
MKWNETTEIPRIYHLLQILSQKKGFEWVIFFFISTQKFQLLCYTDLDTSKKILLLLISVDAFFSAEWT